MDTSWLGGAQFNAISIGSFGLITTNWAYETFMDILNPFRDVGDRDIYGSFTATRVDATHFTWHDIYNFETHAGEPIRNLATEYGSWRAGSGKGFDIYGVKPNLIPGAH